MRVVIASDADGMSMKESIKEMLIAEESVACLF